MVSFQHFLCIKSYTENKHNHVYNNNNTWRWETHHDKTDWVTCAPNKIFVSDSEDSFQTERMLQADPSFRRPYIYSACFVMLWLAYFSHFIFVHKSNSRFLLSQTWNISLYRLLTVPVWVTTSTLKSFSSRLLHHASVFTREFKYVQVCPKEAMSRISIKWNTFSSMSTGNRQISSSSSPSHSEEISSTWEFSS